MSFAINRASDLVRRHAGCDRIPRPETLRRAFAGPALGADPMTAEQAQRILSEQPPRMETGRDATRYVEAWMVQSGASNQSREGAASR